MNLKQYKNCNGCRASTEYSCSLGYKRKSIHGTGILSGIIIKYVPLEKCLKPKTIKDFTNSEYKKSL